MRQRSLPFTVYPKKAKTLLLFVVCLAFVAGGILMIRQGQKMGWLCAGFFGLGIPIFLMNLHPKSSFLTVDEEGIEFCSLFRTRRIRWSDVSEFGTFSIRHHGLPVSKMVGFNYSADYQRAAKGRALSKAMAGFEGGLPDTYGFRAEELARILSEFHRECILKRNVEPDGASNRSRPVGPETNRTSQPAGSGR